MVIQRRLQALGRGLARPYSKEYIYDMRGPKEPQSGKNPLADSDIASYNDVIEAYSKAIAQQRTGRMSTIPNAQDKDYAYKAWKAMERHIQASEASEGEVVYFTKKLPAGTAWHDKNPGNPV